MSKHKKSSLDKFLNDLDAKFNVPKRARKAVRAKTKKVSDAFNIEKKAKKAAKRAVRKTKTKVKRAAKRQGKKAVKAVVKKATASRRAYDRAPVKPQSMLNGMYANGWTSRQIEVRFGISMSTQRRISQGKGARPGQKHLKTLRGIKSRKAPLSYSETAPEGRRPRKSGVRELKNHIVINVLPGEDASWVHEATTDAHQRGLGVVTKYWPDPDEAPAREPAASEPDEGDAGSPDDEAPEAEPEALAADDDGSDVVVSADDDAEVDTGDDVDVITDDADDDWEAEWAEIDAAEEDDMVFEDPSEFGDVRGEEYDGATGDYGTTVVKVSFG